MYVKISVYLKNEQPYSGHDKKPIDNLIEQSVTIKTFPLRNDKHDRNQGQNLSQFNSDIEADDLGQVWAASMR